MLLLSNQHQGHPRTTVPTLESNPTHSACLPQTPMRNFSAPDMKVDVAITLNIITINSLVSFVHKWRWVFIWHMHFKRDCLYKTFIHVLAFWRDRRASVSCLQCQLPAGRSTENTQYGKDTDFRRVKLCIFRSSCKIWCFCISQFTSDIGIR